MTHGFKAGGGIQCAGGNENVIAAARIPKQAGTALLTEATVYIGSFIGDGTKAAMCPWVRRHLLQWHLITSRKGPRTSYCTAPQRQPPVALGVSSPFELISAILSLN